MPNLVSDQYKIERIYDTPAYEVWIVMMPELHSETYGIVNKETGVIENLQPILYNAKRVAEEFSKWATEENDDSRDFLKLPSLPEGLN